MNIDPPKLAHGSLTRLDVIVLGRFAVAIDGAEVPGERWPSLRAAQLVQLLCLQPHQHMTRDEVIDALWPQLAPEAGAANLRKAAHHARQALGRHDGIVLQGGEVLLWPERPVTVDALHFEQNADAALTQCDPAACADVAATYPGDLLPGARFETWAEATRERLRERQLQLLRASGQWERLTEIDPEDEAAHRALMQRELAAGNRSAALRWYARLREALQQGLGVPPDAQTQALYERCIAGLQAAGPAFVGRAQNLAQAAAWLGMAASQRPGGIVLRGPAGIGKSALSREIATQAQAGGWAVRRVQASQSGRTYAVMSTITEGLIVDDRSILDRIGAQARTVLALLSPQAGPADSLPGPLGRHQVVGAIHRLLLAAAHGKEVLLQVDDAHLADDADVDVMAQLAATCKGICVLLATRPPATGSALATALSRLQRSGVLHVLDMEPLPDDECRRLVARAAPASVSDDVVASVVRAAEGNPFAAIELARSAGTHAAGRLPGGVAEAITERLCDVPDSALSLLKWLALSSDEFNVATADALAADAQAPSLESLDAALATGVLLPLADRYRFRHHLVQQALIDQIPPHRRLKMHARIAVRLTELDGAPADIARHWLAAGRRRDALPWLLAAAREAIGLAAFSDVRRHLEPLLAFAPDHAEGLRLRAEALDAMGEPAALAAYHAAADVAGEPESHNLRAKAALAQVKQGDPKGGLMTLAGLKPTSIDGKLAEALAYSGAAALGASDPHAALHAMEDASASVRGPLETYPGCRITFAVPAAIAAARAGELALAEKHEEQCAYLADVVMRLPAWYAAHDEVRGHIAAARGDVDEARTRFTSAAARFREAGHPIDAERCDRCEGTST